MNFDKLTDVVDSLDAVGFLLPLLVILAWFGWRRFTLGKTVPSYEFRQVTATVITPLIGLFFAMLFGALTFRFGTLPDANGDLVKMGFAFNTNEGALFAVASMWMGLVGFYLADRLLFETVFRNFSGSRRSTDLRERKVADLLPPGGLAFMALFALLSLACFVSLQAFLPGTSRVIVWAWIYYLVAFALAAVTCYYTLLHLVNRLPSVTLNARGDLAARRMTALRYAIGWIWGCVLVMLAAFQTFYGLQLTDAGVARSAMLVSVVLALATSVWLFWQARRIGGGRVSARLEDVLEKDYAGVRTSGGNRLKEQTVFARLQTLDISHGLTTLFGDAGGPGFGDFDEDDEPERQPKRQTQGKDRGRDNGRADDESRPTGDGEAQGRGKAQGESRTDGRKRGTVHKQQLPPVGEEEIVLDQIKNVSH
ncbi:hypothetical protein BK816_00345 [Boudabousia tangfeifanii]|uniref:Uncharacterized protein n=1 Tax=Boudabousia tangfeifanii TaxID=1912795 RepID=A0A1D9MIB2_9ACTO|nr:hypothetical protein [Boudabousia tangfeifanii]AOZ71929.1 hypothetical protein BK816_00345 [Boudabousia tangfeifanii]